MDALKKNDSTGISILDGLAMQARMLTENITMNMFQLGRVFCEAKPLVEHGKWEQWLNENSGMSDRTAQKFMQAWNRFGSQAEGTLGKIDKSKVFRLLSLPEGEESGFLEKNDVSEMTTREIEQAVKRVRDEKDAEIQAERMARKMAEARAKAAEEQPAKIPQEMIDRVAAANEEIEKYKAELSRAIETAGDAMNAKNDMQRELIDARRDLKETEQLLQESQDDYNRVQAELLNAKSMIAKGDAERVVSEHLTSAEFAAAVRQFISVAGQMPYMASTFAGMNPMDREQFETAMKQMEDWTNRSRVALNTMDGGVIYA